MSTATAIEAAIVSLILPLTRAGGGTIVPQTTLSAQATAGATTATGADTSRFTLSAPVFFNDGLAEPMQTVLANSGTVLTFDYTGATPTHLASTHAAGAVMYTNLMAEVPIAVGSQLALGDPFIFVTVLEETETRRFQGKGNAVRGYVTRVQYHRSLIRPDAQLMDPNRWAYQAQQTARADLDTISDALRASPTLGGQATMLGQVGAVAKPIMTRSWRKMTADKDTQTFVAALDVTVTGSAI